MASKAKKFDSLVELLDESDRPIYGVDVRRRIVYCNRALADWLALEPARILGRQVEYHSDVGHGDDSVPQADPAGTLSALCPPPRALAGQADRGTVSCVVRDGRLVHRRADFIPLSAEFGGVIVLLAGADMLPGELAATVVGEPTADELHRAIRRFRSEQAARYAASSLLGVSSAMLKARSQVAAAAASGANVLLVGPSGSGRGHIARVIHYHAVVDATARLIPVDCSLVTDEALRRAIDALQGPHGDARHRATLLLENLEQLDAAHQAKLLNAIRQQAIAGRIIGTLDSTIADQDEAAQVVLPALIDAISTITIHLPRLVERLQDLPLLAQSLIESCNRGNPKQVGSIRPDALDLLALYSWPGELDELQAVLAAAHQSTDSHEIKAGDLPEVIHHAANAAAAVRRKPQPIVLDELLATIEKELITRALRLARGNKSEAAALLGMTRARLYRRLVQLGLAGEKEIELNGQQPEFFEQNADEQPS